MKEKYDKIGAGYNRTRRADGFLLARMHHHLHPAKGKRFLDIGCGTGNYTIGLHKKGLSFTGVDPSEEMLDRARQACSSVNWLRGSAEAIPLPDRCVDGALTSLSLHHWASLELGFGELRRVLKPGCPLVIFTSTPRQMEGYWLNHYFPQMMEDSIAQMPDYGLVQETLAESGFTEIDTEKYFVRPDLNDLFLYSGKHRPLLYLDPKVRHGISSFSALANAGEVRQGLAHLEADIESGKIKEIMARYQNEYGDYLFAIAR